MNWLESQIDTRARLDAELTERAYAELARSVGGSQNAPRFHPDDLEQIDGAVRTCLRYCGVKAGNVPDTVTDVDERIDRLCRQSGTMYRKVQLTKGWYKSAFGVLLGTLDTGEQVALLPGTFSGYYYHEPGSGKQVRIDAKAAEKIQPEAIFFYRPLPQGKLTVADLVRFIVGIFDRRDYILILLAAAAATLVGMLPTWANAIVFSEVIPSGQMDLIAPIAALLVGVAVSSMLIQSCRNLVMARVSTKLQVTAEAATFSRLLLLPTSFFKQYASGNLASRVSQVTTLVQQLTSLALGSGLTVIFSITYIYQISLYAPVLVLPAIAVAVIQAALTVVATILAARRNREAMKANATLSGSVTALLNGVPKIKIAGAEDRAFARWAHDYAKWARLTYNSPVFERILPAIVSFVGLLGNIVIYYNAGVSALSVADYMAFNIAFGQVTAATAALAAMAGQIAQIGPMLEMVSPILEAEPEVSDDKPSVDRLTGAIEVSNISFRYEEKGPYIVRDLSFKVKPGEYVALVGKSGCGKSTILRMLLGFEEPERGSIFYGPYAVNKVDLRSLRQSIGVVMQDGKLFLGDIASNITISNPNATLDDAWEAAEIAGIADDIRKMPMGMQTMVTEGSGSISGGQRQRIMIARAVCGKRRILMLDEATSALDNITQKHVADSLEKLKCTRIVVAHRLSTVKHCDRILVVDGGCIAEEGTYDELIERDGIFAELVARQRMD